MQIDNAHPLIQQLKTITDRVSLEVAIREAVLDIARAELGTTDPARYFADAAPCYEPKDYDRKHWCQIFALYCYRKALLTRRLWVDQIGYSGDLVPVVRSKALPADLTILQNNKYGVEVWHGAIFVGSDGDTDHTIDGNTSTGVDERERDVRIYKPRPGYYSIQRWVDALADALEAFKGIDKGR
jgi:hypothetical protein